MSSSSNTNSNITETLKVQVDFLLARLATVERRLETAEEKIVRLESENRSNGGFELVTNASSSLPAQSSAAPETVLVGDTEARRLLAQEIGRFLVRCVRGQPRGTSGRDRLKLQNRLYIILGDFEGNVFDEPIVAFEFAPVKSICKRGSDCGKAIFVGLATKWEARIVLQTAGYSLPSCLNDA